MYVGVRFDLDLLKILSVTNLFIIKIYSLIQITQVW